jgi:hypothetical protein
LNEKLARSQIIGGIGQAIFEETIIDAETGRIANATLPSSRTRSSRSDPTTRSANQAGSRLPTARSDSR